MLQHALAGFQDTHGPLGPPARGFWAGRAKRGMRPATGGEWGFQVALAGLSFFLPGRSFPGEEREGHDSGGNCVSQGPEGRCSRTCETCLRDARGRGQPGSPGRLQAPITRPCIRAIRDANKVVAGGLTLRIPTPAFLVLLPASFYLADPSSVAAETRVAAQMPTEPDRYSKCGPDGRQQGVVRSVGTGPGRPLQTGAAAAQPRLTA